MCTFQTIFSEFDSIKPWCRATLSQRPLQITERAGELRHTVVRVVHEERLRFVSMCLNLAIAERGCQVCQVETLKP